ncbi:hypothetical protein OHS70_16905 [Streptomyces sp. NBC_00390]|uniref:hypothetical protein n=1 Tax=Streptomyces sp. NBC_00390 TaxID=2975736 RepID=UPI002E20796E
MSGVAVAEVPRESAAVPRRRREGLWWVRVRARVAAVAVVLAGLALPVAAATPAAAAPGTFAYVTNQSASSVSVIDTGTNTVTATVPVGTQPFGVAVAVVPASTAACPVGSVITGGGFELTGPAPSNLTSKPVNDTWQVSLTNPTTQDITATPYAVCADNTP